MMMFWLGAIAMLVVATLMILVPWIKYKSHSDQDSLTNTQIIKQRLTELEREVGEGLISQSDKEQAVKELKLALVDESSHETKQVGKIAGLPLLVGLLFAIGVSGAIYYHKNTVSQLQHWQQVQQEAQTLIKRIVVDADPSVTAKDIRDLALVIRTRLIDAPDDPVAWLLLGRLHYSTNDLESALGAFDKALKLNPDHLGVLSSYTQALLSTGQEEYIRKADKLIRHSIAINPQDVNALGMLAITSTQLGDKVTALNSWQKLKSSLPENDPMGAEIDKRIAALSDEPEDGTSVLITVSLDESLQDKLPENAFLFVFAQDAQGQVRMPAAVVKNRLGALPVEIKLSDANAMMPSYKLSQLSEVKLVARISLDENVAQAQGELQGETIITMQQGIQTKQQITINKELM